MTAYNALATAYNAIVPAENLCSTQFFFENLEADKQSTPFTERTLNPTVDKIIVAGGKEWLSGDKHRVYLKSPVETTASDFGSKNKNYRAKQSKLFFDVKSSCWICEGHSDFRDELIKNATMKFNQ